MDVKEKLVELFGANTCKHDNCADCEYCENEDACIAYLKDSMADDLIAHGVTVQASKVVEIDQFRLPIDDAILILKEEHKQRTDGYVTHLSYGGKGDPAEEVHLDALEMAIAALEWLKQPAEGER